MRHDKAHKEAVDVKIAPGFPTTELDDYVKSAVAQFLAFACTPFEIAL